jgi:hypothetical protein
MARVRLLASLVGPGVDLHAGDTTDRGAVENGRLVAAGIAEWVGEPEAAIAAPAVERAIKPRGRGRG